MDDKARRRLDDGGSLKEHLHAWAEGRLDFTPEDRAWMEERRSRATSAKPESGVDIVFPARRRAR